MVPGQHGDPAMYASDLETITKKLVGWAGSGTTQTKLLFAITSPMLNSRVRGWLVQRDGPAHSSFLLPPTA